MNIPPMPSVGASIDSFLQWENQAITALGESNSSNSIWKCWQAAEGLCITAKERRLPFCEHATEKFQRQNLEVAARRSGGTTVPHGTGILAITYIVKSSGPKDIAKRYLEFCEKIQAVLKSLDYQTTVGPAAGAYCDGEYNVLINDLKLAGTSQRWTRAGPEKTEIVLNHAVMLVTKDSKTATARVNQFHQLAEQRVPFHDTASTSLWETLKANKELHKHAGLNKQQFFNKVAEAFDAYQPE